VSIAQQIATPTPDPKTRVKAQPKARRPPAPLQPIPERRTFLALARIIGLIGVCALGTALIAGTVAIGIMMFASSMGG
jgi:hypothetical protein